MTTKHLNVHRSIDDHPNNEDFKLHNHNGYEIYMFISGDAEFIIEGTIYPLKPYDILIIRNDEMHHVHHFSDTKYERIVISLDPNFFTAFNCEKFKSAFLDRELGCKNKIPSNIVYESGLLNAIHRLISYADKNADDIVAHAVTAEILYLLNTNNKSENANEGTSSISAIISYINSNITENLSLDRIANHFFISKYHLCKAFKTSTGYTVNGYINHKRILLVKELCKGGSNISTACMDAGFRNYSNFYKIYIKENGNSPKDDLKKQNAHPFFERSR